MDARQRFVISRLCSLGNYSVSRVLAEPKLRERSVPFAERVIITGSVMVDKAKECRLVLKV